MIVQVQVSVNGIVMFHPREADYGLTPAVTGASCRMARKLHVQYSAAIYHLMNQKTCCSSPDFLTLLQPNSLPTTSNFHLILPISRLFRRRTRAVQQRLHSRFRNIPPESLQKILLQVAFSRCL